MTKLTSILATSLLAAMAFAPAHAADAVATLRIEQGNVMTSVGGEFATASTGARLVENERLMITEGSSATVLFDNNCSERYTAPGVYAIDANCTPAVAVAGSGAAGSGVDFVAAGEIAAGVAVGAAILGSMDETPPPPVSR